ncbi:MAG: Biopolymer transport protein ExbD [Chlamydiae bacterium]|nr:Biopolymer transport protein ExbD [Chlamydiota bacterium]NGX46942.1 Biopolymer transport protein ExbD [Chlamydiota bacterium]
MRQKRLAHFSTSHSDESGVNLTPLIDVVFVVLIVFILIAPMLEIDKVKLAAGPTREMTEAISSSTLTIHVQENNSIWINKREIAPEALRPILQALYVKNPKFTPQLYHDQKAYFGTYQMVKNSLEEAGFTELDVVLQNEAH